MKTLNRSKLNYKLRKCRLYPLIFADAPSGFGKTTALDSYFRKLNFDYLYFSMYGQQDEQWSWDKIINLIMEKYHGLQLPATIPETRKDMDRFISILSPLLQEHLFIIFDDVAIDDNPKIINTLLTYSHVSIPFLHFVVITNDMKNRLNLHQFSKEILYLNTSDFAFTKAEIEQLCRLENISLANMQSDNLYHYTNGWVIAIIFVLEAYRYDRHFDYHADIDNLIQHILFDSLEPEIKTDYMRLSILKKFTYSFATKICKSKKTIQKLIELEKQNHFIHTTDHHSYQFIPILKDFLTKVALADGLDVEQITSDIAYYYLEEDEPLEAIELFLKMKDFESIMNVYTRYTNRSFSDIAPDLMIKVFETLPDIYINKYPNIYLRWILDCITSFPQLSGPSLLEDFKQRIDSGLIQGDKQQLYGEYYLIHAFLHFNNVEKMMEDFKTSHHYFNGRHSYCSYPFMITSFGSCHMLFLYYNQPSNLQKSVNYIEENLHYFIEISNGVHTGTIPLVKGEYLYETAHYDEVRAYALTAYKEAMNQNQWSAAICALFLMGRLALMNNNHMEFKDVKKQLIEFYNTTDMVILHRQIDMALAYLYALNNDYDSVATWLKEGDLRDAYLLPEASILTYIIHGVCLIKELNMIKLKETIALMRENNKEIFFVLAEIYASIFETIYLYKIANINDAIHALKKVIQLCQYDSIISPFVELSFAFQPLLDIYTVSTLFEEKMINLANNHLATTSSNIFTPGTLTTREVEILNSYAQGKMMKDIALEKNISINTIRTHMKSIYKKLNITSKQEAIEYYRNNF